MRGTDLILPEDAGRDVPGAYAVLGCVRHDSQWCGLQQDPEMGRWVSEQSLRTYIDITASSSTLVSFRLRALTGAMGYACAHLLSFFPGASQYARAAPLDAAHHGSEGLEVGQGPGHVSATARGASVIDARCVLAVADNVDAFGASPAIPFSCGVRGPRATILEGLRTRPCRNGNPSYSICRLRDPGD